MIIAVNHLANVQIHTQLYSCMSVVTRNCRIRNGISTHVQL